jgi:hypothetical protein
MKLFKTIGISVLALSMCTGCTSYKERVKADNQIEEITDRESDDLKAQSYELGDFTIYLPKYFSNTNEESDALSFKTSDENCQYPILSITTNSGNLTEDSVKEFMSYQENDNDGFIEDVDDSYEVKNFHTKNGKSYYYSELSGNMNLAKDGEENNDAADLFYYFIPNNRRTSYMILLMIQPKGHLKYNYESEFDEIVRNISINDEEDEQNSENASSSSSNSSSSTTTTTPSTSSNVSTPSPTMGEKNALGSAREYLSISAFSYSGLIHQLEYEGYSTEEAAYAADNCNANWNEQAAKSAKEYLDISSFSRQGLIDQLIYEGYTQEQAEYGATQNGY